MDGREGAEQLLEDSVTVVRGKAGAQVEGGPPQRALGGTARPCAYGLVELSTHTASHSEEVRPQPSLSSPKMLQPHTEGLKSKGDKWGEGRNVSHPTVTFQKLPECRAEGGTS